MRAMLKRNAIIFLVIFIFFILYLAGLSQVPFHPDESTNLFMSADFERTLLNLPSVVWQPERNTDQRQTYRLLDPPLSRYWIGFVRALTRQSAPEQDWSWTASWQVNQLAGALPADRLLFTGRLAALLFFPFTLWFTFAIGNIMGGRLTGWFAMLLLAINPLVLLHSRRAMAESALLFGLTFSLWAMLCWVKRPGWIGIPLGIAICAKQLLIPFIPVGLLAVSWPVPHTHLNPLTALKRFLALTLLMGSIVVLLNPYLWAHPIQAAQAAVQARSALMAQQIQMLKTVQPERVTATPPERFAGLIAQVFINPPDVRDVGNYQQEIAVSETQYLQSPFNHLLRGLIGGGVLFLLTLMGILLGLIQLIRGGAETHRTIALCLLVTLFQTISLLVALSIPWQRYYLPLVPLACLWIAFALTRLVTAIKNQVEAYKPSLNLKKKLGQ